MQGKQGPTKLSKAIPGRRSERTSQTQYNYETENRTVSPHFPRGWEVEEVSEKNTAIISKEQDSKLQQSLVRFN